MSHEFFDHVYAPLFKKMARAKPRVKINKTGDPDLDLLQEILVGRATPTVAEVEELQRKFEAKEKQNADQRASEVAEQQETVQQKLRSNLWARFWRKLTGHTGD